MAAKHCCVPFCTNDSRKAATSDLKISFHLIPKAESLKKRWIVAIRRDEGPLFKVTSSTYVCSEHFTPEQFKRTLTGIKKLKDGAVPTLFQWITNKLERPPPKKRQFVQHDIEETSRVTEPSDNGHQWQPIPSQDHDYASEPLTDREKLEISRLYIADLESRLAKQQMQRFCLERFTSDESSISDKEITRVSGLLDLLDVGDEVMADKGFLIQDLLQKVGVKLVIPPFLGLKEVILLNGGSQV
ncbi:THAP domain-containing protein 3-like [Pecten maximus]|uniref:THAP domain-containing protein 3-like n=1 Tax=Pecten maximus TaxID=6579 RepID=UPI0014590883|nr:THAP domain-containing protein 3-like [Pecten maximus]